MRKKLLAVLLSVSLVFTLAACGNEDVSNEVANNESSGDSETGTDTVTENDESEVSTEESNEVSTEDVEIESTESVEPEVIVHEHAYIEELVSEPTCTSVGLKKFTCECGEFYEEGIDMLSHEIGDYVYNNDATYEKDGTESASCKVCKNVVETRTKTGTMLVKTPEPEIPAAPAGNGPDTTIGNELALNGTITSYNGATLNKLASFNMAGLYNCPEEYASNYEWFGYMTHDTSTPQGSTTAKMGTNMYNIEQAVGCDQGFTIWNDIIYFYFGTGGAAGAVELRRYPSKGYYTIIINYDINQGYGSVTANDGRDVVLAFCSMISSTPLELESAIYNSLYGEVEPIGRDTWTPIGDCYAMTDMSSTWENHYVFRVKPQ